MLRWARVNKSSPDSWVMEWTTLASQQFPHSKFVVRNNVLTIFPN